MAWLAGTIGPQRGPSAPARLRAQWRQIDVENREALTVRRQWMAVLGMSQEEIDEHCRNLFDLCLADELEELSAAMSRATKGHRQVRIDSTGMGVLTQNT